MRPAPVAVATATTRRRRSVGWRCGLIAVLGLALAGCGSTASRAPTETRSGTGRTITGPTYKVRAGDTLQVIAAQAGIDRYKIVEWNQLTSPDRIYAGQVLRLTPPRDSGPRPTSQPARATPAREPDGTTATDAGPVATRARPPTTAGAGNLRWEWPTAGRVVERFSAGDPNRKGVKIAGKPGQSIVAAESGSVVYSGSGLVGYGQLIIVKHNNNYLSAYGHNRKLLVQQGDQVTKGKQIAEMGLAGGVPLLHFEIRRDGDPVDPLVMLPRR